MIRHARHYSSWSLFSNLIELGNAERREYLGFLEMKEAGCTMWSARDLKFGGVNGRSGMKGKIPEATR